MVIDASDPRQAQAVVNRILLVEDEADTADFVKTLLESNRYQVLLAKDGGQAHSTFVMRKPDFVILDLILPGESGFEICERFKLSDPTIPVLIVSAIELDDSVDLARRVGADGYLTKPFDPPELINTIRRTAETVWNRSRAARIKKEDVNEPVRFNCRCGKRLKVSPSHRGKTMTCPNCGESVMVPRH